MKNENLIHVKLEHKEALQSKKDILSSEMNLLRILQIIKKYHWLRSEELQLKLKFNKKIKEMVANIKKLQKILPELQIPSILKKEYNGIKTEKVEMEIEETGDSPYDKNLEQQLLEIQEKLKSISK
jgi:hypothetical protein